MNVNLGDAGQGWSHETIHEEIDEHREIMINAGVDLSSTEQTMLLSDPEYPGAYRVWLRIFPPNISQPLPVWVWVNPDGEVVNSTKPWGVK